MVVRYIKVTFVTIFALVVGLISTVNIKGAEIITDLTGYTWVGNDDLNITSTNFNYYINFSSSSENYSQFWSEWDGGDRQLHYGNKQVYDGEVGGWFWKPTSNYETIQITGGTDATNATLIAWLEANGVLQTVYYTQEDLDNAWADGYDAGVFTVYENGFAGIYNPYTAQLYNNEDSFSYLHGWYVGYDVGYDEAVDGFDYEEYYSLGIKMAYMNGFGGYINPLTNEYYDITNSFSYIKGYDDALADDFTFTGLLFQVFDGVGSVLSIELLPNVTLGAIVAVPIVFGIIYFILGKRKGD